MDVARAAQALSPRVALLFLTNKIERIPQFDILQSTFGICHAGVSFPIRPAVFLPDSWAKIGIISTTDMAF